MSTKVIMPQMGESLAEGTITKWLKKVGDAVERDEPLFEISTDKVDAEIPAPASGTLVEITAEEGVTVEVNAVVGVIAAGDEKAAPKKDGGKPAPEAGTEEPETGAPETEESETEKKAPAKTEAPRPAPEPAAASMTTSAPAPAGTAAKVEKPFDQYPVEELRKARSSPVVRKIAAEHQVDLSQVEGTGVSGRVTKQDILEYVETAPTAKSDAPAPAPAGAPAAGAGVAVPDLRIPPFVEGEPVIIEPMTMMRKKIAEHMIYSQNVSAHVTSFFEFDFEEVAKQRRALKAEYAEKGVHLTYMPFIVRAVVEGLRKFPYVNASVMGDKIVFKKEINVGIAVALDDGKGLIVPVIRGADEKNLLGLGRAVNDLGERARTKKLMPEEVQRGTFSITNPGVFGGLMGTPIINQPQVAILGMGAIEKRPVVVNDAIGIRHRAYVSLSYDHRLVDGAMAEMFMAFLKQFIEAGNIQ
jgi:2-oxoglutarate dehydrogenase E2 component (dihydrolipoamide succinyltransferase)